MTSMPASRSARAMTLAPRSWPSRPGLATGTRIGGFIMLHGESTLWLCRCNSSAGGDEGDCLVRVCELPYGSEDKAHDARGLRIVDAVRGVVLCVVVGV